MAKILPVMRNLSEDVKMEQLKKNISDFRAKLANMLNGRELRHDEVYKLSIKLDKLILEYQKHMIH